MPTLRPALRRLALHPGFTAIAILTLALGIGANTAIFSIVDGALLQPLSFPHPEQLISLHQSIPQFAQKYPYFPVNAASFQAWRHESRTLSGLALMQPETWVLTGSGEPRQISGASVSQTMFSVLGVSPSLGRDFLPREDEPGQNNVVLLAHSFWRSQFHSDPGVIGRTLDLNGSPVQIVGVLPSGLHFPHGEELGSFFGGGAADQPMQVFRPAGINFAKAPSVGHFDYVCFARMRPGVGMRQVRAELDVISAAFLAATHAPRDIVVNTVATSLRDQILGTHVLGLWLLLTAVGAILLIVCLNLANLFLVRIHGRSHELALRLALGAGRARLVRETMSEGILLSLAGGALGVLAAEAALRSLVAAAPAGIPRLSEVSLNSRVLLFSFLLALAAGALFSLWPGLRAAHTDPQTALRASGRGASDSRSRLRARAFLVGIQAALASLLLILAGLLAASFLRLLHVDKGYQTDSVIEAQINWPSKFSPRVAFYESALQKLRALPGVTAVGLVDTVPSTGSSDTDLLSMPHDTRPLVDRPLANFVSISPDYFAAMGIPLLRGRTFTAAEMARPLVPTPKGTAAAPIAAVITATTAARIWPGQDAMGQQFQQSDSSGPLFTVVGISGDIRQIGLDQPPGLDVYLPYTQNISSSVALMLRASEPPAGLAPAIRSAIWSLQPDAAVPEVKSMDSVVSASLASRRFQLSLIVFFALCALLLAGLGIYGVVAYSVERRTAEIGLRMTLGAESRQLVAMVMRQGLTPVAAGLAVGVGIALLSGKLVASLMFGVSAADPAVILTVSAILLLVAAFACALPARRATSINPVSVLRP